MLTPVLLSSAFPPHKPPLVNPVVQPDSSPLAVSNPSILPPPLPVKTRDLIPSESHPPDLRHLEDGPADPAPPLARSGTARVSFREPISSSYSVDVEEEEEENEEELREGEDGQQVEEEVEGGFGSRLNLQKGIPPQMDLLGKQKFQSEIWTWIKYGNKLDFVLFSSNQTDPRTISGIWGEGGIVAVSRRTRVSIRAQRGRTRHSRTERPQLDTLDWRGEKDPDGRGCSHVSSLSLQPGHYKHEDSCSTCSSSSDSEEGRLLPGDSRSLCPPSSGSSRPRRARTGRGGRRRRCRGTRGWEEASGGGELTASAQRTKIKTVLFPNNRQQHRHTASYLLTGAAGEELTAFHYTGIWVLWWCWIQNSDHQGHCLSLEISAARSHLIHTTPRVEHLRTELWKHCWAHFSLKRSRLPFSLKVWRGWQWNAHNTF